VTAVQTELVRDGISVKRCLQLHAAGNDLTCKIKVELDISAAYGEDAKRHGEIAGGRSMTECLDVMREVLGVLKRKNTMTEEWIGGGCVKEGLRWMSSARLIDGG
jgi:hypothetical protein